MIADNAQYLGTGRFHNFDRSLDLMSCGRSGFDDEYDACYDTGNHDGIDHEAISGEQGTTVYYR